MAISERKHQEKLARKAANRKRSKAAIRRSVAATLAAVVTTQSEGSSNWPIDYHDYDDGDDGDDDDD
jgi:hypothetical protein